MSRKLGIVVLFNLLISANLSIADTPHGCSEPVGAPVGKNTCFTYAVFIRIDSSIEVAYFEAYGKTQKQADAHAADVCRHNKNIVRIQRKDDETVVCSNK